MGKKTEEIRVLPGMSTEERQTELLRLSELIVDEPGLSAAANRSVKVLISSHMIRLIRRIIASGDKKGAQALLRTVIPSALEFGQRLAGWKVDGMGTGHRKGEFDLPNCYQPHNIRRLYPDRIILIPSFKCPVLCRYCFRRAEAGNERPINMQPSLDYIRSWNGSQDAKIRDVILSGGDPLSLSDEDLGNLLAKLRAIPGVQIIRIDTKYPVVRPERITEGLLSVLAGRVNIMTLHFTHPLEICDEVVDVCRRLSCHGMTLRSYTPLLKGVNDDRKILKELFWTLLSRCGISPYYAVQFIETPGAQHFRIPLAQTLDLMRGLHEELSGQAIPNLVIYLNDGGGKYVVSPHEKILMPGESGTGIRKVEAGYKIPSPLNPGRYSFYPD